MSIDHHRQIHATPQRLIDEKVAHLEVFIRQLKAQRNEVAPISKLPPEILARIFFLALAGRTRASPVLPCYYFSHVSEMWRSVALNTPTLWQVLPRSIPWATAMLERSKGADLVVESHVDSSRIRSFLTEVLTKHTSRIRELDLFGPMASTLFENLEQSSLLGPMISTFLENLEQSSLRLHALKLECSRTSFPTGVLETSNLRTLSVTGCGGPWCSLPLPALTYLKLYNIPNPPHLVKSLEMLRGAATLEVLDMCDSIHSPDDLVGLIEPFELPLRYLCLSSTSNYKEVTNILSAIIVPRTATLKLAYSRSEILPEMKPILDALTSSLKSFFRRLTDLSYRNLHVSNENFLCLQAWKDDGVTSVPPDLELALPTPFHNVLLPIILSIPLFHITTLTLDNPLGSTELKSTELKDCFGQLSLLQNVKVVGNSTELILALTNKPKGYNTNQSAYHSVSFPALQSLWIEDYSFKETLSYFRCTVEVLQDCLMERYERGAEILKLKLTHCLDLWYADVCNLRHIVNDVEWDEWEEYDESDAYY